MGRGPEHFGNIELTLQDGGPNDSDQSVNGAVADPGAIGIQLSDPQIEPVQEGAGRLSPILLTLLLLLAVAITTARVLALPAKSVSDAEPK